MKNISRKVTNLIQKYKTKDPIQLADNLGIMLKYNPYSPKTKGLYIKILECKFIILNSNLKKEDQIIILAHLLGHIILHFNDDTVIAWENALFPQGIQENEANLFALKLLNQDDSLNSINYHITF